MDFEEYVNTIEETLCPLGNVQTKDINYGVQIILTDTAKKVTLNIYNGKKKKESVSSGGAGVPNCRPGPWSWFIKSISGIQDLLIIQQLFPEMAAEKF